MESWHIEAMRPTRAEINLENLSGNFQLLRQFVRENVKIMAVVKADGYGHGAVLCAKRLEAANVDWFGVALPEEALELRQNGIEKPILSLGGFWEGQESLCLKEKITPVIFRLDMAESLDQEAKMRGETANVHIKIDTGMNRLGVRFDAVKDFAEGLRKFENLRVEGLMTHFAGADEERFDEFTAEQIRKFEETVEIFREKGFQPEIIDLANSPATLAHRNSWGNLVRIGGALYGIGKDIFPASETVDALRPVMSLKSEITLLKVVPKGEMLGYSCTYKVERDSLIATIPIGYNDGLPRTLSNIGRVLINGNFAPMVGRISMDLILVDVTNLENVQLFEEVVIIGEQNGRQISTEDVAKLSNTISYEITCGISKRVPRISNNRFH